MKKIILTIIPSVFLGIIYFILRVVLHSFIVNNINWGNILVFIFYIVLPTLTIFITVQIKRKYLGDSNKLAFYYSLLPGFIMSFDFSYGAFATGHGYGFANYLNFLKEGGYWIFVFISLISGIIGLITNFIWNKLSKKQYS